MEDKIELQAPEVVTYISMIDYKNKFESAKEMYHVHKRHLEKWIQKEYKVSLEENNYEIVSEIGKYYLKVIPRNAEI